MLIIGNTTDNLVEDINRDLTTNPGETITCIRCNAKYTRGIWDFYSLCNSCFVKFDEQKMRGRFSTIDNPIPRYESARDWVKENPYKEDK